MPNATHLARACAADVRHYVQLSHAAHGIPMEVLIAGVHGEAVSLMAMCFGATGAAEMLRRAADEIEAIDQLKDRELLMAEPVGRA